MMNLEMGQSANINIGSRNCKVRKLGDQVFECLSGREECKYAFRVCYSMFCCRVFSEQGDMTADSFAEDHSGDIPVGKI